MLKRVMSKFSVENFLSHSTEKLCTGTVLAMIQKISGIEKVYG